MRKVKTFREDRYEIEGAIEKWLKENPTSYIVSVNGVPYGDYDLITYVLYEERTGISLNS